jgi:hypothetical protein
VLETDIFVRALFLTETKFMHNCHIILTCPIFSMREDSVRSYNVTNPRTNYGGTNYGETSNYGETFINLHFYVRSMGG